MSRNVLSALALACGLTATALPAQKDLPAPPKDQPPPSVQGTPAAPVDSSWFKIRLTGNFYAAFENWPDVGAEDDPKFGFGLGGMFGAAFIVDDMRLAIGPHMGYNIWTADYSQKPSSATQSVTIAMADLGWEMQMAFDDLAIYLGKGTATMEAYMVLDNGDEVAYPGLDGEEFGYQTVGIGFKMRRVTLGIAHTSYDDNAVDASRLEIRFSIGF